MIRIELPSGEVYELKTLLCDFNGTLAVDGVLSESVKERLRRLSNDLEIAVITSDTQGSATQQLEGLPVRTVIVPRGGEPGQERERKREELHAVESEGVVFLGNGSNDAGAIPHARLSIVVLGLEGAYGDTLRQADLVVTSAEDALDLLLKPKRLISGLRY